MRRLRGAELLTGKSVGADERVGAEDEGGVCWARQVDMLFTRRVVRDESKHSREKTHLERRRGRNWAGIAAVPLRTVAWLGSAS